MHLTLLVLYNKITFRFIDIIAHDILSRYLVPLGDLQSSIPVQWLFIMDNYYRQLVSECIKLNCLSKSSTKMTGLSSWLCFWLSKGRLKHLCTTSACLNEAPGHCRYACAQILSMMSPVLHMFARFRLQSRDLANNWSHRPWCVNDSIPVAR